MRDIPLNLFEATAMDRSEVVGRHVTQGIDQGLSGKPKNYISRSSTHSDESNLSCSDEPSAGRWDLRQIQKLASIRDLMSKERCFDMDSRAASIRSFIGHEREFSLQDALAVVDEFDDDLFAGSLIDFNDGISLTGVPTIEKPSKQSIKPTLLPTNIEGEPEEDDIVFFSGDLGFRSDVNHDFNPFDDIDRRMKAAKLATGDAKGVMRYSAAPGDATDSSVNKTPRSRKPKLGSNFSRDVDTSMSSEESSGFPWPSKPATSQSPHRTLARHLAVKVNLEREKAPGTTRNDSNLQKTKAATNERAVAQGIVSEHLEARLQRMAVFQEHEAAPTTPRRTRRLTSRKGPVASETNNSGPDRTSISTAHAVLSEHFEARLQRTASAPTDSTNIPPSPRSAPRRTTRRTTNRHKSAEQLERLSTIAKVEDAISKHIEARAKASMSNLVDSPKQRTHSPSRRTTRRVTSRSKSAELPPSPNTITKAQEVLSNHLKARVSRKPATMACVTPSTPQRSRPVSSRRSTAAQIIKEHLERLQLQRPDRAQVEGPQAYAFDIESEWVTEATSERSDDPFSITASSVTSSRSTKTSEWTDENTSERSDDPFCVTASSGPSRLGTSPRRKPSSRRTTKSSSRGSRRGAVTTEHALSAAELPPLPELSALPFASESSNHDTSAFNSLF